MWAEPLPEAARRDSHTIKVGLCYVDADWMQPTDGLCPRGGLM